MTARWQWLKLAPFVGSAETRGRPLLKECPRGQASTAISLSTSFKEF